VVRFAVVRDISLPGDGRHNCHAAVVRRQIKDQSVGGAESLA